jgi:hypothetical protein
VKKLLSAFAALLFAATVYATTTTTLPPGPTHSPSRSSKIDVRVLEVGNSAVVSALSIPTEPGKSYVFRGTVVAVEVGGVSGTPGAFTTYNCLGTVTNVAGTATASTGNTCGRTGADLSLDASPAVKVNGTDLSLNLASASGIDIQWSITGTISVIPWEVEPTTTTTSTTSSTTTTTTSSTTTTTL